MTPNVENLNDMAETLNKQGTETTIVAIFLVLVIIAYVVQQKQSNEDKKSQRQETEDFRHWQKQRVEKLDKLNDKMIEVIYENNSRLNQHDRVLATHSQEALANFKDINAQLKVINTKLDDLYRQSQEKATKEGLDEVRKELEKLEERI